jgi:DNA-binding response OmpR family regulator
MTVAASRLTVRCKGRAVPLTRLRSACARPDASGWEAMPHQPPLPTAAATSPTSTVPLQGRRILLVEDEVRLSQLVARALARAGADVEVVHDGEAGLARACAGGHDVVVLDILLPRMPGDEVLRRVRGRGHQVPVLMLTARDGEDDQVDALASGADDYVVKPFSTPVLIARLANLSARRAIPPVLTLGRLRLAPAGHRTWLDDVEVGLTAREYAVLVHLVTSHDRTVSKQELLDEVWAEPYADPNLVEVCVAGLRRKLGPGLIDTVRQVGYRATAADR